MKSKILNGALFLPIILSFILSTSNLAQRYNTDTYEFKDNFRINTKTQVAEVMYSTNQTVYKGMPEEVARQFLSDNKTIFGINNISDLKLIEVIESPGGNHVGFIQTYKGIPIFGSETVVSINNNNQVEIVTNGCLPIIAFKNTSPNIDKEKAISNAKLQIKLIEQTLVAKPKCELYVYPDSNYKMHLVWKVNLTTSEPSGDWQIIVDANSGKVMESKDIRVLATGQGKVFRPDPVTALQNTSLTDQNDANYSALQGAYVTKSLPYLNSPIGGVYRLQGSYARSEDLEYSTATVTSSTSSFLFNRSQAGFEETNGYYFITTQRQYVGSLGFSPKWNGNNYMRFDAHGTSADNSWYNTSSKYLIFGNGCVDDAEDQDVILHEYAHALHDALMVGSITSGWVRGISEGSGDFMAVSYRRTLSSYQQNKVFPWDGIGQCWSGREIKSNVVYPNDWTNYYTGGTVWASTMLDIENYSDMGRNVTTKLLLKSFNYANSSTIVPDQVYYMMKADQTLYSEAHLKSLGKGFENRGFFNSKSGVHPSNYLNGNITSSTTWSGIKWINGTTYIKSGVTVTSYGFLFIGDFKKIIIENGGALYIQGSLTKYPGADIIVKPGGTLGFSKRAAEPELVESTLPSEYSLLGNYPNPFNPSTTIKYSLPKESSVELKIYDIMGREIKTFAISSQPAGNNEIHWDGTNNNGVRVTSGVYIYRIKLKALDGIRVFEKCAKLVLTK